MDNREKIILLTPGVTVMTIKTITTIRQEVRARIRMDVGTLGVRQEYILGGLPVYRRVPYIHTHLHTHHIWGEFEHGYLLLYFLGDWQKPLQTDTHTHTQPGCLYKIIRKELTALCLCW